MRFSPRLPLAFSSFLRFREETPPLPRDSTLDEATIEDGAAREAEHRREVSLVPPTSIAGRALVTVIAIMTFLAAIGAGTAVLIADASHEWRGEVSREVTIQVHPTANRDLDADTTAALTLTRATPGVADARAYTKAESESLLQPWLGSGLDLSDLPVPRLIVIALDNGVSLDVAALRQKLTAKIPTASLDDHRLWLERLDGMAQSVVVIAIIFFLLVLAAMSFAIAFATQGAMAENRGIIEVLHFVGAADSYISRQFQYHFLRLGLRGGALGGACAIFLFLFGEVFSSWWKATPAGDQMQLLFGSFSLSLKGYAIIVLISGFIALLTGFVSREIVYRHLRGLN
ncbi:protein of unknown function DUF214 [Beijerinckia indica subsp. indica ATCC 9039]|uniref:Cell division protein FtsX n=1 Tax=Beijerinckia indica subsp. indica (strain ATCC 9039 / DSM 1715 / NCIMB 8712) TaxID=395963 RepID=B2IDG5_BEII9|nr:protein of unknown function DUF214 [Beijerinckia indica subsp. indica ATCC 9039]